MAKPPLSAKESPLTEHPASAKDSKMAQKEKIKKKAGRKEKKVNDVEMIDEAENAPEKIEETLIP